MSDRNSTLEELRNHPVIQRSIMVACMGTGDRPSCADVSCWKGADANG